MTTRKQAAANRKNAQKSTGPKTEEGKTISAMNALKHGMLVGVTSSLIDPDNSFNKIYATLLAEFRPIGVVEIALVRRMAVLLERERRGQDYEHAQFSLDHFDSVRQRDLSKFPVESETFQTALRELNIPPNVDEMLKIARYQRSISAEFSRAYRELISIQKARLHKERISTGGTIDRPIQLELAFRRTPGELIRLPRNSMPSSSNARRTRSSVPKREGGFPQQTQNVERSSK